MLFPWGFNPCLDLLQTFGRLNCVNLILREFCLESQYIFKSSHDPFLLQSDKNLFQPYHCENNVFLVHSPVPSYLRLTVLGKIKLNLFKPCILFSQLGYGETYFIYNKSGLFSCPAINVNCSSSRHSEQLLF